MHTEEEAKELWCPHVRHVDSHEESSNCTGAKRVGSNWNTCVGSRTNERRNKVRYHSSEIKWTNNTLPPTTS